VTHEIQIIVYLLKLIESNRFIRVLLFDNTNHFLQSDHKTKPTIFFFFFLNHSIQLLNSDVLLFIIDSYFNMFSRSKSIGVLFVRSRHDWHDNDLHEYSIDSRLSTLHSRAT